MGLGFNEKSTEPSCCLVRPDGLWCLIRLLFMTREIKTLRRKYLIDKNQRSSQWKMSICFSSHILQCSGDVTKLIDAVGWRDLATGLNVNRQMERPIMSSVSFFVCFVFVFFFASAYNFPNSFQGWLIRWFWCNKPSGMLRRNASQWLWLAPVSVLRVRVFCVFLHFKWQLRKISLCVSVF